MTCNSLLPGGYFKIPISCVCGKFLLFHQLLITIKDLMYEIIYSFIMTNGPRVLMLINQLIHSHAYYNYYFLLYTIFIRTVPVMTTVLPVLWSSLLMSSVPMTQPDQSLQGT